MDLLVNHKGKPLPISPINISPNTTIGDLKKKIADEVCEEVEDVELEDEDWPSDDDLVGQKLQDGDILNLDLPLAGCNNITFYNATDETLKALLVYTQRDVTEEKTVNVHVDAGLDMATMGGHLRAKVEAPGRKYETEEVDSPDDLPIHRKRKVPISNTLYKGIIRVKITKEDRNVVRELTAAPGHSIIISAKSTEDGEGKVYNIDASKKKGRGWGYIAWMPEGGGASMDPHGKLEPGMECRVEGCGYEKRMPGCCTIQEKL